MLTSKPLRLGKTFLVLFCLCVNLSPALAQTEGAGEDHASRGLQLYRARRFDETIVEWEQALKEQPGPDLQFSLARVYFQLGRYPRALELYTQFLLEPGRAPIAARIQAQQDKAKCEEIVEKQKLQSAASQTPPGPSGATTPAGSAQPPPGPPPSGPAGTPAANQTTPGPSGTTTTPELTPLPDRKPAPPVPAVDPGRGRSAKRLLGRPVWRVAVGAAAIGVGLIVGGFGVGALAVDGSRVEAMDGMPAGTLETTGLGAGLLAGGLALAAGGAILIAIPEKSHPAPDSQFQLIRSTLQGL